MSCGDGMDEQRCSYEALIAHTTCYLRLLAWTCQRLVELGIRYAKIRVEIAHYHYTRIVLSCLKAKTAISKICGSFNVGIVFMLTIVDVFVIQLSVPLQVAQTVAS